MDKSNTIACICEGGAENAIMDILLENNALIFEKRDLLDDKIIKARSAKEFEQVYLRKSFSSKIIIYRILDSKRENFKLGKLFKDKCEVINIITALEIEMLLIHSEDKYEDYKKSGKKPSDYCKEDLKYKDVKSYNFVKSYFKDINKLICAIKIYKKKSKIKKSENCLFDLLNDNAVKKY